MRQIATFRTAAKLTWAKYGTSRPPTHVHRSQDELGDAKVANHPTRLAWRHSDPRDARMPWNQLLEIRKMSGRVQPGNQYRNDRTA